MKFTKKQIEARMRQDDKILKERKKDGLEPVDIAFTEYCAKHGITKEMIYAKILELEQRKDN